MYEMCVPVVYICIRKIIVYTLKHSPGCLLFLLFSVRLLLHIINYSKIVRRCRKIGILYYVQVQPSESKINCAVLHLLVK